MPARLPLLCCWLLFLLLLSTAASFKKRDRCTFQFSKRFSVTVLCQGKQSFSQTLELPQQPSGPIEIIQGVRLFGDALGDGQRSFFVVENRELELYNIRLEEDTLPSEWNLMSPIAAVNSKIWLRSCVSHAGSNFSKAGSIFPVSSNFGLLLSGSVGVVRGSRFSADVVDALPIEAGAIRLTNQSTLSVFDSEFERVTSQVAAIYGDQGPQLHIRNSEFVHNEGREGSAVFLAENGNATIVGSVFRWCESENAGTISMTYGRSLELKSCVLKLNKGYSGAAIHFETPAVAENFTSNHLWPTVSIIDSVIESNTAARSGGGIYMYGGSLLIDDTVVDDNQAAEHGGGVCVSRCHEVNIQSSHIEFNKFGSAPAWYSQSGAGIFAQNVIWFRLLQSRVDWNVGVDSGGGAYFSSVHGLDIQDSVISNNTAGTQAGVAARSIKNMSLSNVTVADNSAMGHAGGMMVVENVNLRMKESRFVNNVAVERGAAIIQSSSSVSIDNCYFKENVARFGRAAALHIDASLRVNISQSVFLQNAAIEEGGGILAENVDFVSVDRCSFKKNTASTGGAVLIRIATMVHVTDSEFVFNEATDGLGGSIMISSVDRAWIQKSIFTGNCAKNEGGAVAVMDSPTVKCTETQFNENNSTMASGGGIIVRKVDNVFLKNCYFQRNYAHAAGGAASLESVYNDVDISETSFVENAATGRSESDGGAMAILLFSRLMLRECLFRENRASRNGGAMYLPWTKRELVRTVDLIQTSFLANHAESGSGGALFFMKSPRLSVDNCLFNTNQASVKGGAIVVETGAEVSITASRFELNGLKSDTVLLSAMRAYSRRVDTGIWQQRTNEADRSISKLHPNRGKHGGAVSLADIHQFSLANSVLESNTAPGSGGAIHAQDVGRMFSSGNRISGNTAWTSGGGMFVLRAREVIVNASRFHDNWVSREEPSDNYRGGNEENGGAMVFKESQGIYLERITCLQNHATLSGGAISINRVTGIKLKSCIFGKNAAFRGGAIQVTASNQGVLDDCQFTENEGLSRLVHKPRAAHTNDEVADGGPEGWQGHGGAILFDNSRDFNLTSPLFQSNKASGHGGALHSTGSLDLALSGSQFLYNSALLTGGAVSLSSGNLSLNVDQFTGNHAADGGILAVDGSVVNASGLATSRNVAQHDGGLIYCHRPSNVSVIGSKFVDDGSLEGEGSSFKADCECYLSVQSSKIVCSNAEVSGCGRSESNDLCRNQVILDAYHVIHYNKFWTIFKLIATALVILPMIAIMARLCMRMSALAVSKAGFYEERTEEAMIDGMPELWGPMEDPQRRVLSRPLLDKSVDDIPFWRPPHLPPASTFDSAGSIKILESHCIDEPLLVSPQQDPSNKSPAKSKPELVEPFMKQTPLGREVTRFAYSALMGSSFCLNHEDLTEQCIDIAEARPSTEASESRFSTCHPIFEQQDFRYEYDEITEMRDL